MSGPAAVFVYGTLMPGRLRWPLIERQSVGHRQAAVAGLVERICESEGVTVLLVAHDVNPILPYLDRVVYFAEGRGIEGRPREVIEGPTLSRLYGSPGEVLEASDGRLVVVGTPEPPGHHHGCGGG